jgi:SulP family sulfate permease
VLAFLPAAGLLSPLSTAALAGLVIAAVASLVRIGPILRLLRFSPPQFGVAATTFGLTLALSPRIERTLVTGIVLAVCVHLWRERALEISGWREGDTLHLRPHGVLWFGSIERLEDGFLHLLAEHADARQLALHLDALGRLDSTGALSLQSLLQQARDAGLEAEIVEARPRWRPLIERVIAGEHDPLTTY